MRFVRPQLVVLALICCVVSSGKAQQGTPQPGTGDGSEACQRISQDLAKAEVAGRMALARAALKEPCRPMPAMVGSALGTGQWSDSQVLSPGDRMALLALAVEARYPEAETLAVRLLEEGKWPGGSDLLLEEGGSVIRSLGPALTPYRVHLLLDIFEQREQAFVRTAILETLRRSPLEEALLPALEAYFGETGDVQQAALATLNAQPEKTPPEVLLRLVRNLPDGPSYRWAVRLGKQLESHKEIQAAIKQREGSASPK